MKIITSGICIQHTYIKNYNIHTLHKYRDPHKKMPIGGGGGLG